MKMRTEPNESERKSLDSAIAAEEYRLRMIHYSKSCGPRVVALALGITVMDAAVKLVSVEEPKGNWEFTSVFTIARVLGKSVEGTARTPEYGAGKNKLKISFSDKFPTLSQWMNENPGRRAIVRADHHFSLVAYNTVIDRDENMRGRVTHVIFLD